MNTTAHDFVTVDMRGLRAALVARAHAERLSVSVLVRGAVARDLGVPVEGEPGRVDSSTLGHSSATSVKLSIRMTNEEARQLAARARASGLSRGAYLAGLISNVVGGDRLQPGCAAKWQSWPSVDGGDRQLAGIPKQSQTDHPNEAPRR